MPSLLSKVSSPMGMISIGRPWAVFSRPKRTLCFIVACTIAYCFVSSWGNAKDIASLIKDNHGVGVVFRLGGNEAQGVDESTFNEDQLPFDGIDAASRKSDAETREEFEKEYKEAGR